MRTLSRTRYYLFALFMLFSAFTISGCYTHVHVVGNGGQSGMMESKKVWYVAFGLAPISTVDTREMAQGATDYTIKTEQTFIDGLISAILGGLVGPRTVTVTR